MPASAIPVRDGSRDGSAARLADRRCPLCAAALPSSRARYCSAACRQGAYRRRQDAPCVQADVLAAELRRLGQLVARTVSECPTCGQRLLGARRCDDCQRFCRKLGLGGACPGCDEPILITELLGLEVTI
jgi:hypothetical protein